MTILRSMAVQRLKSSFTSAKQQPPDLGAVCAKELLWDESLMTSHFAKHGLTPGSNAILLSF
jgi:hypothetical protein